MTEPLPSLNTTCFSAQNGDAKGAIFATMNVNHMPIFIIRHVSERFTNVWFFRCIYLRRRKNEKEKTVIGPAFGNGFDCRYRRRTGYYHRSDGALEFERRFRYHRHRQFALPLHATRQVFPVYTSTAYSRQPVHGRWLHQAMFPSILGWLGHITTGLTSPGTVC